MSVPSFFFKASRPAPHEGVIVSWPQRIMLHFKQLFPRLAGVALHIGTGALKPAPHIAYLFRKGHGFASWYCKMALLNSSIYQTGGHFPGLNPQNHPVSGIKSSTRWVLQEALVKQQIALSVLNLC